MKHETTVSIGDLSNRMLATKARQHKATTRPQKEQETKRKVRLPNYTLDVLRELSLSYQPKKRTIPSLVASCLRGTRGVDVLKLANVRRKDSERIDITLSDEFADLEHAEIVARVCHALIGIQGKLMQMT
jgi:hypothetical protein